MILGEDIRNYVEFSWSDKVDRGYRNTDRTTATTPGAACQALQRKAEG